MTMKRRFVIPDLIGNPEEEFPISIFGQPQFPVITIISLITTTYSAIPRLEIIVVDA
jgi:hypothetical protein